jgi:hypothetical protein
MDDQRVDREGSGMSDTQKCASCGGSSLESGSLTGIGAGNFVPHKTRTFLRMPYVPIVVTACIDCGAISISADPSKLQALLRKE